MQAEDKLDLKLKMQVSPNCGNKSYQIVNTKRYGDSIFFEMQARQTDQYQQFCCQLQAQDSFDVKSDHRNSVLAIKYHEL